MTSFHFINLIKYYKKINKITEMHCIFFLNKVLVSDLLMTLSFHLFHKLDYSTVKFSWNYYFP